MLRLYKSSMAVCVAQRSGQDLRKTGEMQFYLAIDEDKLCMKLSRLWLISHY